MLCSLAVKWLAARLAGYCSYRALRGNHIGAFYFLASPGGETEEEEYYQQNRCITYDVSKLINYPGFNTSVPSGVADVSTKAMSTQE